MLLNPRRIFMLLLLVWCAEAHSQRFEIKGGNVPNQKYVDYYKKAGYPDNVAQGLARILDEEGGSIPRPRKGDKYERSGFSVANTGHLFKGLKLAERDWDKNPVTEEEALSWVPMQFKGWDLKGAGNANPEAVASLLSMGYLANPDKSKKAFEGLLAGKPVPFPSDIASSDEKEQQRINKHKINYSQALGLNFDGTPDGSTSSSRSQGVKISGYSPLKVDYKRGDVDIKNALINPLGVPRNAKQPPASTSEWYESPLAAPVERPRSAYRELLERIVRGEDIGYTPPNSEDLLKEAQDYARQKWPKR
jgi:hypothetical protein